MSFEDLKSLFSTSFWKGNKLWTYWTNFSLSLKTKKKVKNITSDCKNNVGKCKIKLETIFITELVIFVTKEYMIDPISEENPST